MEAYNSVFGEGNSLYIGKYHTARVINNLKEFVTGCCSIFAENPAFWSKDKKGGTYHEIKYKEFGEDINALGTELSALGLTGKHIAVIGENCYDWVVAYFATVLGGGVIVPLDKELSKDELDNLLDTADCSAIFYTKTHADMLVDRDIPFKFVISVYDEQHDPGNENDIRCLIEKGRAKLNAGDTSFTSIEVEDDKMCSLLFTSGTTGTPKGVMLSHRNIASNIMNTAKIFDVHEDDIALSMLPIHHTYESNIGIMGLMFQGGSVAFLEGLKYIQKNMQEAHVSFLVGVPLIFENLYDKIWKTARKEKKDKLLRKAIAVNRKLNHIGIDLHKQLFKSVYKVLGGRSRIVMLSGAAGLDPKIVRGLYELGFVFAQGYGLTETAPLVAGTPDFVADRFKKAGSCGPAIPQGEFKIDYPDENGIGEILYRGPNVMLGYYNMPEETAEVLRGGWFHTGDLGFIDSNGWIYVTGRKKNVIVTKTGKNIYPEEIEGYLADIPYIEECMVYGTDSADQGGSDTIVSVQVRPNMEVVCEELGENPSDEQVYRLIRGAIADMNMELPNYKRVRYVVIRKTEFVKTTTKKIKRMDNMDLLEEEMFTEK